MDKLQFLDLSDLNPREEEELNNILYNDFLVVVEMPPDILWTQNPLSYEPEPVNGGGDPPVDYAVTSPHILAPQTMQYPQMMPQPSMYVSNVTANVNVHSFVTAQPVPYSPVPFIQPVDTTPRKPRPVKSPNKRSPEARPPTNYTPSFPQHFPSIHYTTPGYYHPYMQPHAIPRPFPIPNVFPATAAPVYTSYQPVFQAHPASMQQPPAEPREDNTVPYTEQGESSQPQEEDYQPQANEVEEQEPVVDTVVVENSIDQQDVVVEQKEEKDQAETVVVQEVPFEDIKVEKPLVTKAPPANAFKSAPNLIQKPPFPTPSSRQKRTSVDEGPQFIDPPVDSGPPRKSYAQMAQSSDSTATKPLAMIYPTVHSNVSSESPKPQNCADKPSSAVLAQNLPQSNSTKFQPDKMVLADYDINLQRLGEFLNEYQLDHKSLPLQPRGLTNRSNYCYINAILQALVACPPFYNLMKSIPPSQENKNVKSRTPIIDSMVKFVNEFGPMSMRVGRKEKAQATKDGVASTAVEVVAGTTFEPTYIYKMLSAMHAAFPVEGRQEDAEEFLSCLLNGLNDEMLEAIKLTEPPQTNGLTNGDVTSNGVTTTNGNHEESEQDHEWTEVVNKSNKSVVTRRAEFGRTPLSAIFRGQMRSRLIRSGVENGTTDNIQPFFTLQLDVEKASSVEKALELLVGRDEVVGSVCPKTNQEVSMYTQTSLVELPIILLLHLKCFHYKLQTCSKIMKIVEFPVDLKIDNKLMTAKSKTGSKDRQYKLLAVVYHDGREATKGHYVTDVYHMGYSCWVRYDDASVRPVTQQQVLNPKVPRVPYLLYYRRCDTIGHPLQQDKNR